MICNSSLADAIMKWSYIGLNFFGQNQDKNKICVFFKLSPFQVGSWDETNRPSAQNRLFYGVLESAYESNYWRKLEKDTKNLFF